MPGTVTMRLSPVQGVGGSGFIYLRPVMLSRKPGGTAVSLIQFCQIGREMRWFRLQGFFGGRRMNPLWVIHQLGFSVAQICS